MAGPRTLRNRGELAIYLGFAVLFCGIAIALAIGFAGDDEADLELWLALLGLFVLGILCAAYARTKVTILPDQSYFVVQNMFRRKEVPWHRVTGFAPGRFYSVINSAYPLRCVEARLDDGTAVTCQGLSRGKAPSFINELSAELARRRTA